MQKMFDYVFLLLMGATLVFVCWIMGMDILHAVKGSTMKDLCLSDGGEWTKTINKNADYSNPREVRTCTWWTK